ncbi:MAG: cytochrome c [Parvibaculaceae bacterium]
MMRVQASLDCHKIAPSPFKGEGRGGGDRIACSVSFALRVLAAGVWLVLGSPAQAGDIAAGRKAAQVCVPCHGLDGLSKAMNAANIAGQLEPYLIEQLKAYRSGARKHDQMTIIAEPLTDKQIEDLAAYYSAIEITAKVPQ